MRSSRWHAHGNVYLLAEQADLTPERVRAEAAGTDGIVEVLSAGDVMAAMDARATRWATH